jgi:hypothetical protein
MTTVKSQTELDNLLDGADWQEVDNDSGLTLIVANKKIVCRNGDFELRGSSSARLYDSSSATLYDSSSARLCGSSSATLYDSSSATLYGSSSATLYDASIAIIESPYIKIRKASKQAQAIRRKPCPKITLKSWIAKTGVETDRQNMMIFKRVSIELKTREGTPDETLWTIGATLIHKSPNLESEECGGGKFHGCATPQDCDQFRDKPSDRYIAVSVPKKKAYAWPKNPQYPFKIGFTQGTVLYECDRNGKAIAK